MPLWIGLLAGLAFGLASAFANRLWGTVLAVAPVVAWFIFLAMANDGGITGPESEGLGLGLFGMLIGLFLGQLLDRRRRNARSAQR
ncbi:hypothetical protein ACIPVK_11010 [Paeniglutamicibacter sp. MACA_103]|uniref:hypothetical protein n=1 Tax=Paeniglutamicibacter sp. MACA_103 TaxID=3377337 RepID=UPI00389593CE